MQVLNRTSDGLKKCYTILLDAKELEAVYESSLRDTAKKVRLDGFRPGKVPVDIIKRMYGEGLKTESNQKAANDVARKIIKDENLKISFNYTLDLINENEKGLEFQLKFETLPEYELKDMHDISVTRYVINDAAAEAEKMIENIRKTHINWDVEDKIVKEGYKVVADIFVKSKIKGFTDSKDAELIITKSSDNLENYEVLKCFIGAKVGEERDFVVKYPDNDYDKHLAGKEVEYHAVIKKILKNTESKMDDAFAQRMKYENLAAFKEYVIGVVTKQYENMSLDIQRREILEKISDMYDFAVPQNMMDSENAIVTRQIEEEAKKLGKEMTDTIREECLKIAISRVRLGFVVSEVAKRENITVTKKEIVDAIQRIANMYDPSKTKAIFEMYQRKENISAIAGPIIEVKVVDFLSKKMKIVEKKCTKDELTAIDDEPFDFFKDDEAPNVAKKKTTKKKAE